MDRITRYTRVGEVSTYLTNVRDRFVLNCAWKNTTEGSVLDGAISANLKNTKACYM